MTAGFFDVAAAQNPKPQTVAIIAADAEFGRNAAEGARHNAKAAGMTVIYDRTYGAPLPGGVRPIRIPAASEYLADLSSEHPPREARAPGDRLATRGVQSGALSLFREEFVPPDKFETNFIQNNVIHLFDGFLQRSP